ncbi:MULTISPECIES: 3'-5' exonuclease family protein [Rhodococcus]|jgi:oligoribonuclease|uniref:Uncharacterized protein n=1 Tax=Rhodococcus qingshengii JCM 15477 TaxID=1303681 RepID=A0AB38RMY4_RHOSG|nr:MULTISPECIES: hypothetical protein [Rhodococcus]MBW0291238.1 hypothetical protein [Rhodococcus sp. MH15]MEA1798964.1 hypothetical protein [Rhodococcus qingshengii]UPU46616.1 hypothetical protein M0639_33405 [Rhodococcus qingshengii JCM 15477]
MSVDGFVFVDLETTGTEAEVCEILEIGFALYSADLMPIERFEALAVTTGTSALIDRLHTDPAFDVVKRMHTDNGLFADLRTEIAAAGDNAPQDLSGFESDIVDLLARWGVDSSTPLCGSSHRMDREFLARWMPKTDALFSYRIIDASSFREAGLRLDRERTKSRLDLVAKYGAPAHRVVEDMHHSANVLRVFHDRAPIPLGA